MLIWFFVAFVCAAAAAFAQDESENSYIVALIEDGLSTDDRQIRLIGIDGLLASEATIEAITIADKTGVWLTVNNAKIIWSRLALIRGRLEIDELTAESIDVARRPVAAPGLPSPEARTFAIPELPLSVNIGKVDIGRISLAEDVMGQAADLAVLGSASLQDGGLDLDVAVSRLDVPEAKISVKIAYAPGGDAVAVDVSASEPENGLIANMLSIPKRPALDLSLEGDGRCRRIDANCEADSGLSTDRRRAGAEAGTGRCSGHGFRNVKAHARHNLSICRGGCRLLP